MDKKIKKEEKILHNSSNKKIIRHEDFVAGIGKGMAILDSFGTCLLYTSDAADEQCMV